MYERLMLLQSGVGHLEHLKLCYPSSCSNAALHPSELIEVGMCSETKIMPQIAKYPFSYKIKLSQSDVGNASLELLNAVKFIAVAHSIVGSD